MTTTMTDLSHWDAAETFSGQEAAALVVGVDPLNPAAELWRAKPVLDRMAEGHRQARNMVSQPMAPSQFEIVRRTSPDAFVCVLFDRFPMLQKEAWPGDANRPYELPRRLAGPDGSFELQKFSRAEVQRWLDRQEALSTGISSVYQFVKPVNIIASIDAATTAEKPLGERERTTLLNIIGVLVELIKAPKPGRDNDSALIEEMLKNYGDTAGIKERTLQAKFAAAKRSLTSV